MRVFMAGTLILSSCSPIAAGLSAAGAAYEIAGTTAYTRRKIAEQQKQDEANERVKTKRDAENAEQADIERRWAAYRAAKNVDEHVTEDEFFYDENGIPLPPERLRR